MALLDFNQNPNMAPMGLLGLKLLQGEEINPLQMAMYLSSMNQPPAPPQQAPSAGASPAQQNAAPYPRIDANTTNPLPADDNITRIADAIARLESGGKYSAMGPQTKSGDRAYGKYQIMGNNIPSWSREALGRQITADEFLANPQLQDQIAHHRMGQYYNKYGNPQDVASMWFSGRPLKNNNSRDVLGTSVPQYVSTVTKYLNY
jgi:hypothetical protein